MLPTIGLGDGLEFEIIKQFKMDRWTLITSDEWVTESTECIVKSKKTVKETRKELNDFFITYRNELLHGNQGLGCSNKKCSVCYPYGQGIAKKKFKL